MQQRNHLKRKEQLVLIKKKKVYINTKTVFEQTASGDRLDFPLSQARKRSLLVY